MKRFLKTKKVIESCENLEQLQTALNYATNYFMQTNDIRVKDVYLKTEKLLLAKSL